jgi:hypothetical protein
MARNLALQLLRGVEANLPVLSIGEPYFATDTYNLWVGTSNGNQIIGGSQPISYLDLDALAADQTFTLDDSGFNTGGF